METLNCGGKKKKGRNEDNARAEECTVSFAMLLVLDGASLFLFKPNKKERVDM